MSISGQIPIGLNTYCLRALKWNDAQLLDYTASLKLDAVFLQDSVDPQQKDPEHWRAVKDQAARLGMHLETGGSAILPKSEAEFETSVRALRYNIQRAAAMGSPIVRSLLASDRAHFPAGTVEHHMETAIKLLRTVRSLAMDAGVKIAIENHKDLHAWQTRQVIEGAGKEFVGSYLDTGNPVFIFEDPMETVETLGPLAVTVHLRDSVVYEVPRGASVQWVVLGDGVVDFKAIVAKVREVCPPVHIYIKPITGRPPVVMPYLDPEIWTMYPAMRGSDLARFIALAKKGHPYEGTMVVEEIPGKPATPEYESAIRFQQKADMERSVEYAKRVLDLGVRWRSA
ncbi:MAG: Xylose isomerase domain protein barrel [Bryobacterales bacterium]|nr:Xylose isomerase domain protein barrel [Bryobacterales bacterium]